MWDRHAQKNQRQNERLKNKRTNNLYSHLSEKLFRQKNLYRFFSFNFYIELFGVFVRKIFLYTWFVYFSKTLYFVREFVREGLILSENLSENFSSKRPLGQKNGLKPAWLSAFINSLSKFRTFSDKMKIDHFLKTHENKQPRMIDALYESQIKPTIFGQNFYAGFIHLMLQNTSWIFHKEFCPRNAFSDKIGRFSDKFGQNFVREALFSFFFSWKRMKAYGTWNWGFSFLLFLDSVSNNFVREFEFSDKISDKNGQTF